MRALIEDLEYELGKQALEFIVQTSDCHPGMISSPVPPEGTIERTVWALLEVIDFDCDNYDYTCPGRRGHEKPANMPTKEEIKKVLGRHKEEIGNMEIAPPSMIGLFSGQFDFLFSEE